jgi:hypothetical protein
LGSFEPPNSSSTMARTMMSCGPWIIGVPLGLDV